jgi:CheY-like chemotaxis protein/HPt (histidine-containing phosphotransfer) domain-containing protein
MDAITSAFGAAPADEPRRSAEPAAPHGAPAGIRGCKVLLVEDNEFNQIVAGELLSDVAGVHVTLARNGREAVERVFSEPFDAVLMDVQMPLLDGYQATALIRQEARYESLPIIAMTAHAMAGDRDKSLAVGMNDYVTKPFEPMQLFAVLAKWVARGSPHRAADDFDAPDADAYSGVSFELGLQRCLGRIDLYEKILNRFVQMRVGDPAEIAEALEMHQLERASGVAHNVISTAGTIGAEGLSEAARALQYAIDAGEFDRWAGLLATFARHHAVVAGQLRAYLSERPTTT